MNIWIDILHTPQFNFYKPFITMLSERGHNVYVTALNRGKLPVIVRKELEGIPNVAVSVIGRHRMNKISVILEANLLRLIQLLVWCAKHKIDVSFSNGSHVGMMGKIFGFPAYEFEDDPQAADYQLMVKFSTQNHSIIYDLPDGYNLHPKDKLLKVLKEWAYLNPTLFHPNLDMLKQYGVEPRKYIIMREVSVGTLNYADQEADTILKIASMIPVDMPVLLSLEKKDKRHLYPKEWILLQEPIEDIHSLIYYSAGLVSSGDSMAREAALLGVPAYYLGIRYDMPANAAAAKVANLQNQKTADFASWIKNLSVTPDEAEKKQIALRQHIDEEFIDINAYMMALVEQVETAGR